MWLNSIVKQQSEIAFVTRPAVVEQDMDGAGTQPPNPKFANSASYHLAQAAAASAAGTSYGGLHEAAPGVALPTHPVTVPVVQNEGTSLVQRGIVSL